MNCECCHDPQSQHQAATKPKNNFKSLRKNFIQHNLADKIITKRSLKCDKRKRKTVILSPNQQIYSIPIPLTETLYTKANIGHQAYLAHRNLPQKQTNKFYHPFNNFYHYKNTIKPQINTIPNVPHSIVNLPHKYQFQQHKLEDKTQPVEFFVGSLSQLKKSEYYYAKCEQQPIKQQNQGNNKSNTQKATNNGLPSGVVSRNTHKSSRKKHVSSNSSPPKTHPKIFINGQSQQSMQFLKHEQKSSWLTSKQIQVNKEIKRNKSCFLKVQEKQDAQKFERFMCKKTESIPDDQEEEDNMSEVIFQSKRYLKSANFIDFSEELSDCQNDSQQKTHKVFTFNVKKTQTLNIAQNNSGI